MPEMQSKQLAKSKPGPATQRFLDIAEIRDDLVLLNDGTVRGVLMVSSINFALKSVEEQEAIIQAYMTFLNGLEYPLQILIQSRQMNIDGYLDSLAEQQKKTDNELLRMQIMDYRDFVKELVSLGQIMQKHFYAVVPYDPVSNKQKGFFDRLSAALSPVAASKLSKKQMKDRTEQLSRRIELVGGQLESLGLKAVRLDTQSLIELYYAAYNPEIYESQKLDDVSKIRME